MIGCKSPPLFAHITKVGSPTFFGHIFLASMVRGAPCTVMENIRRAGHPALTISANVTTTRRFRNADHVSKSLKQTSGRGRGNGPENQEWLVVWPDAVLELVSQRWQKELGWAKGREPVGEQVRRATRGFVSVSHQVPTCDRFP